MASNNGFYLLFLSLLLAINPKSGLGKKSGLSMLNSIDACWRKNPNWMDKREELAKCSAGLQEKWLTISGKDVTNYVVTDPSDNAITLSRELLGMESPSVPGKYGSLSRMTWKSSLKKLLLSGTIQPLMVEVTDVIIHGLRIHGCQPQPAGNIMGPGAKLLPLSKMDGDAIRLLGATKVWIDHNTLSRSQDGLIDVTLGSTSHDDDFKDDKNMKVTVVYNRFGPNCHQRMPRVRHGYAHVANNIYLGWEIYAIGGSMNPSIKSESNLFVAPKTGSKEIMMSMMDKNNGKGWNFKSVGDILENGAVFNETGSGFVKPNYNPAELFPVESGKIVRQLTRSAGALRCQGGSIC
ncbi:putative pectate lyase 4 [Bienertia sinuspersici]